MFRTCFSQQLVLYSRCPYRVGHKHLWRHTKAQQFSTEPKLVPEKNGAENKIENTGYKDITYQTSSSVIILRKPESSLADPKGDTASKVTVVYKPSQQVIKIPLKPGETQVSLFFRKHEDLVNLSVKGTFREDLLKDITVEKAEPDLRVQSIDEFMWKEIKSPTLSALPGLYMSLAKIRLTGLVVITAMAGYAMAPGAFDLATFAACTIGTALTSASANAINQYFEVPFDAQMNRTKNRPLVRGHLSPLHAVSFAGVSGAAGVALLAATTNPLTASLGAFNLALYTMAYTPMKRWSIGNTWLGSVVGAIPPLMGWAAATGGLEPGAWLLAAVMYAWQFPHFNALSWNLRPDYSRAGYRMASVVDPNLCKRVALRYSVGMVGICLLAPVLNVTTWTFAADSLPLNLYLVYLGYRFYRDGDSSSSRRLFRFSLIHLPALLILMLISKKWQT